MSSLYYILFNNSFYIPHTTKSLVATGIPAIHVSLHIVASLLEASRATYHKKKRSGCAVRWEVRNPDNKRQFYLILNTVWNLEPQIHKYPGCSDKASLKPPLTLTLFQFMLTISIPGPQRACFDLILGNHTKVTFCIKLKGTSATVIISFTSHYINQKTNSVVTFFITCIITVLSIENHSNNFMIIFTAIS